VQPAGTHGLGIGLPEMQQDFPDFGSQLPSLRPVAVLQFLGERL
jgi:hypothetical protein